ncbi:MULTISPECIES: AraC family transcriptional regulator [unclassified Marinobacter]|uniref:AraC family transcriptional regulator n=1 Tax=unclassified Marinobacter TaxID=83889 RepID=UPI0019053AD9|nr:MULTISPECIES: AraC family transcriptional regulator [unclassified Marinobacter]MBK1872436.1 AraC family transcriptional regulator [Marinobacter sp. 1-3A]MBK1887327.1 AraC family transcriptional regulator [Marinobacter sp. DY40_1A1]
MRVSASNTQDLGMPAIYLHILAELLKTIGLDERDLLLRVGLDPVRLQSTDVRVSHAQANEFVTRAIIESGEPGLGIMLARELKLPLHGALGVAVMSSRTLKDALDMMTRYLTLRAPHLRVSSREHGDAMHYTIRCDGDPGPLQGFIVDAMLFGCAFMGEQLTGTTIGGAAILRKGPEPSYFRRFRQAIVIPVNYGSQEDALVIPQGMLSAPIRFSDDQLAASSRAQCEDALKQLTEDAGFGCRVRRVIETSYPFPPKLARVAATLFVSERTLKRRLQEENASFQNLVDQVRLERARELLTGTSMNLNQIADVLGYADAANFTRAFKRWTGSSPSRYRDAEEKPGRMFLHSGTPAHA